MRKVLQISIIVMILLIGLFVAAVYIIFLSEPVRPRLEYYSDNSNYITATGTVVHLRWSENQDSVCLAFEDIPEEYSDVSFEIEGENLRILVENGFAKKVKLGTEVMYVSAPRYFWDGYCMPIVELSVDGEILLPFDEGKMNLLDLIRN